MRKLTTVLFVALVCSFALVGSSNSYQRFVPFPATEETSITNLALDTKTGQACVTTPKESENKLPNCVDLAKQWIADTEPHIS